jgi:hypothetical protein
MANQTISHNGLSSANKNNLPRLFFVFLVIGMNLSKCSCMHFNAARLAIVPTGGGEMDSL